MRISSGISSPTRTPMTRTSAYRINSKPWVKANASISSAEEKPPMLAFAFTQGFELILYALVLVMGVLVGLEIPLLMRIIRDRYQFRDVIAHVLTFDYLGALGA